MGKTGKAAPFDQGPFPLDLSSEGRKRSQEGILRSTIRGPGPLALFCPLQVSCCHSTKKKGITKSEAEKGRQRRGKGGNARAAGGGGGCSSSSNTRHLSSLSPEILQKCRRVILMALSPLLMPKTTRRGRRLATIRTSTIHSAATAEQQAGRQQTRNRKDRGNLLCKVNKTSIGSSSSSSFHLGPTRAQSPLPLQEWVRNVIGQPPARTL